MIGYRFRDMLRDLLPFVCIALAVMVLTGLVTMSISNKVMLLASRVLLAAALYAMTMKLTRATIFKECIEFISTHLKK